jgi:hypothetical protein
MGKRMGTPIPSERSSAIAARGMRKEEKEKEDAEK